jgi:hypothetical protein
MVPLILMDIFHMLVILVDPRPPGITKNQSWIDYLKQISSKVEDYHQMELVKKAPKGSLLVYCQQDLEETF